MQDDSPDPIVRQRLQPPQRVLAAVGTVLEAAPEIKTRASWASAWWPAKAIAGPAAAVLRVVLEALSTLESFDASLSAPAALIAGFYDPISVRARRSPANAR